MDSSSVFLPARHLLVSKTDSPRQMLLWEVTEWLYFHSECLEDSLVSISKVMTLLDASLNQRNACSLKQWLVVS